MSVEFSVGKKKFPLSQADWNINGHFLMRGWFWEKNKMDYFLQSASKVHDINPLITTERFLFWQIYLVSYTATVRQAAGFWEDLCYWLK